MQRAEPGPWRKELDDFIRALSGAFLFGVPLLYTMEMWWIGDYSELWRLGVFLGLALVVNFSLARFAGFKQEPPTLARSLNETVDAVAVGVLASLIVLVTLNRITLEDPLDSILGKVIIQAVPLSLGASAANIILAFRVPQRDDAPGAEAGGAGGQGGQEHGAAGQGEGARQTSGRHRHGLLADLGATIIGGLFISLSIAPTEEIPTLAAGLTYVHEIALIVLSLALTYAIVFESGFDPQRSDTQNRGPFRQPWTKTVTAYVVALGVAGAALFLFQQVEPGDPIGEILAQTLALGLPASIGGAAGRLVL
jgi:putative integral membrane protein (TIGR02587 family)